MAAPLSPREAHDVSSREAHDVSSREAHDVSPRDAHRARAARQYARVSAAFAIVAGAVLLALGLRTLVLEPFNVPSESMLPTLEAGDYLFVAKWPYGFSRYSPPVSLPWGEGRIGGHAPERGDVVVFKTPRDNRTDFIKRIIGLPGDRVRMVAGRIELNGVLVTKVAAGDYAVTLPAGVACHGTAVADACRVPRFVETIGRRSFAVLDEDPRGPHDDTPLVTVPAGHYFVAGDNRDDSADSRMGIAAGGVGLVPAANLLGRAEVVFFGTGHGVHLRRIGTRL